MAVDEGDKRDKVVERDVDDSDLAIDEGDESGEVDESGEGVESDDERDEGDESEGNVTNDEEIIEHLFRMFHGVAPNSQKYSVRYWLAIILARSPKLSEVGIAEKFCISPNIAIGHINKDPVTCNWVAPTRRKYDPTSASDLVAFLCKPDEILEKTYSLRFWLTIANFQMKKVDRIRRNLSERRQK